MTTRVVLERDVGCTLPDGTVLMADVYRPDDAERYPVLLQRTPYDKTFFPFTWGCADPTKLASFGYAVVIQDTRGRFQSTGEYSPYTNEEADGRDAVAWAATQPWSDGSVGMYGASYMAGAQWLAAVSGAPALRAIVPATSPNDILEQQVRRGGAIQLGLVVGWLLAAAPHELIRTLGISPELFRELPATIDDIDAFDSWTRHLPLLPFPPLEQRTPGLSTWLAELLREDRTAFHDSASTARRHADIAVPALQLAGWNDLMIQSDLDHFVAMRSEAATEDARRLTRIVIGPWAHAAFTPFVGDLDFGFRAAGVLIDLREDLTGLHRRWFDARLKGIPSGIDAEPPVKLFVMGRNRWRDEDEWPLTRAKAARWHLHGSGAFAERPPERSEPSVFTLDPEDPVPTTGGAVLLPGRYTRGPREQSPVESRNDVLVFTSESLAQDLEVTGRVRANAWIAADTVDTDVVVKLCDVHPDGRSYNVADGIQRARFRDGLYDPKPLTPGEPTPIEVDLWSTSHVFLAGHRLRVQVAASDFPRYDRCPGSGESSTVAKGVLPQRNQLFHDPERPSYIELPVVTS
ncbi:MAG: CocE/NonD family hydrolase [Actinomycetota bacterium]